MARNDYYNDPSAPAATSIVVAVTAFVQDEHGRLLMIQRTDNDLWSIPGGAQDIGETIGRTVAREVKEETGIDVEPTSIIGVYTDPRHVIEYTSDGEVRQEFSICFRATPIGGQLATSSESKRVHWVERERLPELTIHPSIRLRIDHGFQRRSEPYFSY
ncbi:ADP-ribose pyrophosphatase YjhB, NUDIX family [Streptoalloteichus tenebrarius]|uniref:ADP-ribose pyrophosphatase YjhB, NUDIX family n=1 Tax=Streptoalloteichus tenebrarius (strain ATCC 17920 / DSM 40477 / JCM 4838 / CBS 697.72 / NBRC 16177 / NCIMB 11028 / NRRL B-12390 / A12253. 1 / ISP 5477) TaxID=1933 RepID=A0ABT1HR01_STRSD|nr:NUDIX domain-containing protein [Streptoalloteichus tenebrarius]MCP2257950.1 ADP-ribose pyrophosphatase YjhB, NUDIX family [Streptoalloteichus tenebrarius]BFF01612.1 NUDIX domain-containing protein [Streptoalloteichus tenebrarius]